MALIAGVFVVPFRISPPANVISASALAGYNNTAAYGIYLILLVVTAVVAVGLLKGWRVELEPAPPSIRFRPSWPVAMVMAGHAALFAGLYLVKGQFVFSDGLYFQHLLVRMAGGAVPYRDLNFLYGPAMLYPAHWLGAGMSVAAAYAFYYVAMYLAGLYLLYLAVQLAVPKPGLTDGIFVLCALGFFNHTLGLNYVFARGLFPAAAVICLWRHLEQPTLARAALAVAVLFCTLAYSPEMGILAAAACLFLAVFRVGLPLLPDLFRRFRAPGRKEAGNVETDRKESTCRTSGWEVLRTGLVCGIAGAALVAAFYLMDPTFQALGGFIKPMLNQVGGAGNRPIYFNFPILTVIIVSVMVLALTLLTAQSTPSKRGTDLLLAIAALSLMMERMAFGVPDSLHVVNNCLPLFLLGLFLVARVRSGVAGLKWYMTTILLTVMLPLQVFNAFMFKPFVEQRLGAASQGVGNYSPAPTSREIQESLDRIVAGLGPERTYYFHALQYYSLPTVLRWHLKQVPYFTYLEEAQVPENYQAIVRELREHQAVVVTREDTLKDSVPPPWGGWEAWLYQLSASPLPGSRIFSQLADVKIRLSQPVMDFLQNSYRVAMRDGEVVVLVPR